MLQHLQIAYEVTADETQNSGSRINIAGGKDSVLKSHPVWMNRRIFTLSRRIKMKRNFIPFCVFIITALLVACSCSFPFEDFPLVDIPSDIIPPSDNGNENILSAVLGIPLEWMESESTLATLTGRSGEYERMIITYDEEDDAYTVTDIENKGVSFSFTLPGDTAFPVSPGEELPSIVSIEEDRCRIVFENIYGEKVVYGW